MNRSIPTALAATAGAMVAVLAVSAAPAYAGSQSWGSLSCGSRYVYSQSFSSGTTTHTHQIVGETRSLTWYVPSTGEWHTYIPGWHSVVNTSIYADVLESASRGCSSVQP